jgi:hypothetical protein
VQPLEGEERSKIVSQRLANYGKKMTPTDIVFLIFYSFSLFILSYTNIYLKGKLTSHPCGSSPLFLTIVLLELCTIGYYAQFQEQLAAFLSCKDMPDLFQRVLARWEVLRTEERGVDFYKYVSLHISLGEFWT